MRGDLEDRTADFCEAQWELVFYVGKRLRGEMHQVCGRNGWPLTRDKPLYKKLFRPPSWRISSRTMCCKNAECWRKERLKSGVTDILNLLVSVDKVMELLYWKHRVWRGGRVLELYGWEGLTSPSQLLMATEAPGTSVMSPIKVQSVLSSSRRSILSVPLVNSVWLATALNSPPVLLMRFPTPSTSSCHSTIAPGATNLLFGRRRRWNSFPKAEMLKKSFWSNSPEENTSLLTRCLWVAESRCDR